MRPAQSACFVGLLLIATGAPAWAQLESREAISLQNQILELRHELEQSGSNGGTPVAPPVSGGGGSSGEQAGGGDSAGLTPQLLNRVQTLEGQVRDLRGELDQLSNQMQQQNAALSKQVGDLGFAVQQAHGGGGIASPPSGAVPSQEPEADPGIDQGSGPGPGPGVAVAPTGRPQLPAPPAHRTPEAALAAGNAAVARRDYAGAEADARSVLAGPRSPRQIDAQFLLGQSLAGQRQYQQAAVAYYDAYNRSPRSGRAPDALLGVSASLLALGDRPAACQALAKLHAEFPSPTPRARNAYVALHGRASCR